jgi:hypothetical protein
MRTGESLCRTPGANLNDGPRWQQVNRRSAPTLGAGAPAVYAGTGRIVKL